MKPLDIKYNTYFCDNDSSFFKYSASTPKNVAIQMFALLINLKVCFAPILHSIIVSKKSIKLSAGYTNSLFHNKKKVYIYIHKIAFFIDISLIWTNVYYFSFLNCFSLKS